MSESRPNPVVELSLLGLLALFWGASYTFTKIAVAELPVLTLIAVRVSIAAAFLYAVMVARRQRLPADGLTWRMLLLQSFLNSFGSWTILAWAQRHVDASLASVLNSTSPIFVFLFTAIVTRHEPLGGRKFAGALLGIGGIVLIVGVDALHGLGTQVVGQLTCLAAAAGYACAAIYGKRFAHITPLATATGIMLVAAAVMVPLAVVVDRPWMLRPSAAAVLSVAMLAICSTSLAFLIYFRLVRTLGSMGVASQSYLRAGIGVLLGVAFLGEMLSPPVAAGLCAAIAGVALINWPARAPK